MIFQKLFRLFSKKSQFCWPVTVKEFDIPITALKRQLLWNIHYVTSNGNTKQITILRLLVDITEEKLIMKIRMYLNSEMTSFGLPKSCSFRQLTWGP